LSRRLFPIDVPELMQRNAQLEHENLCLRSVLQRAICGEPSGEGVTCQLARGHQETSLHTWMSPDGTIVLRW
jgi:hypothetical protein